MSRIAYGFLVGRGVLELIRYDVAQALFGFGRIQRRLAKQVPEVRRFTDDSERLVCAAMLMATCLYWKPVRCLQRAICTVRLLRSHGVAARLVIGYRPVPFSSHAWVEVGSRIVNDSPVYQRSLRVLYTA